MALLPACAGQRQSYEKLMDTDSRVIHLQQGDREEVLAIGNGFPGWWGYYPQIVSNNPSIARIDCQAGRSVIPFRYPGILFGGERCYISALSVGNTWIIQTNKFGDFQTESNEQISDQYKIRVTVSP